MKKQKIFNFALTTMCVAVLSACGSSGGGSLAVENTPTTPSANANANTGADNSAALAAAQQEVAAAKAAAEKAAADKAAAEKAAKDAADKAAADLAAAKVAQEEAVKKAAEEAAKKALEEKAAADKAAAEAAEAEAAAKKAAEAAEKAALAAANKANPFGNKDKLADTPSTDGEKSFVGIKHVVKVNSNLRTDKSMGKDSTSDTPTVMGVQAPHASLDTIVVAEPNPDSAAARVYLEDFDTRSLSTGNWTILSNSKKDKLRGTTAEQTHGNFGNTALVGVYINGTTLKEVFDEKKAERDALNKATQDATTAEGKIKTKYEAIAGPDGDGSTGTLKNAKADLETANGKIATAADETAKQVAQLEAQAAAQKVVELEAEAAKLKRDWDSAKSALLTATLAQNQFDLNNPRPTGTVPSVARTLGLGYETKTDTQGQVDGVIWNFAANDIKQKHQNFTETSTGLKNMVTRAFVYKGKDLNGNVLVTGHTVNEMGSANAGTAGAEKVASRNLDETVAEIYGYRSKARNQGDGFTQPFDVIDNIAEPSDEKTPANNLPLVNEYEGAKLTNVQYGRVTTALHNKAATEQFYKKGIPLDGSVPTYVASFGEYGVDGTENHYFYRGINNVGATELTKLKEDTKNGTITYEGHAVTYGLNNTYSGNIAIPTAVGARAGFVSGNHAGVTINLANNKVAGSIYNLWYDSVNHPKELQPVHLVKFNGTIADNGNIAGTAVRQDNQTTGLFGATLYGNGAEIGGTVASDDKGANKWGGVLGGIRTDKENAVTKEYFQAVGTDGLN